MTPEQAKKLGEMRIKRKKQKAQRERSMGEKKQSHDWYSEFVYGGINGMPSIYKNAGHWAVSHCKRCGLPYLTFKAIPQSCDEVMIATGRMKTCSTHEGLQCESPANEKLCGTTNEH